MSKAEVKLAKLRKIAAKVYSEADQVLIASREVMESGNEKQLGKTFDKTEEAYVIVLKQNALLRYLVMGLARMHDKVGGDRASIPTAMQYLSNKKVRRLLILKADDDELEARIERLEEDWRELVAADSDFEKWLKAIRDMRDITIAHNLMTEFPDKPTYDGLFNTITATLPIVEKLAAVTGVNMNTFNGVDQIWRRRGDKYWEMLLRGGPSSRKN